MASCLPPKQEAQYANEERRMKDCFRKEIEIILTQDRLLLNQIHDYVEFHFKESSSSRTEKEREMHLKS